MQQPGSGYFEAAARPVAELLACPHDVSDLLSASAQTISFEHGQFIFHQGDACAGLYVVLDGRLLRRSERSNVRVSLGVTRPGELVELAAALGEPCHTYSLVGQGAGSLVLLPLNALNRAFETCGPLRMQLLEELAREVSRAYYASSVARDRRGPGFGIRRNQRRNLAALEHLVRR
jgi:CRP-like cAMP-binding protein